MSATDCLKPRSDLWRVGRTLIVMSTPQNPAFYRRIADDVKLGENIQIYDFVNLYGCEIGDHTRIGAFVEIQKGVTVGKHCKISTHSFICEGVTIEDEVFIGHGVMFTNDLYPRATLPDGAPQSDADWTVTPTVVQRRASIGSTARRCTRHPGSSTGNR